jgi:hypothetical protein
MSAYLDKCDYKIFILHFCPKVGNNRFSDGLNDELELCMPHDKL